LQTWFIAELHIYVYAKDAYDCIQVDDVILFQDTTYDIRTMPICYNGTPFTANLVTDALASATIHTGNL
jgi:hypothetical protein